MNAKSMTLVEVLMVLVVIGILATIGYPSYRNFVEDSKAKVCANNLEIIKTSLDIYAMENDEMPGNLSLIPAEYIRRAYAKVSGRGQPLGLKIAYWVVGFEKRGLAYAGLLHDLAKGDIKVITCPADHTPPPSGVSYALNSMLKNMKSETYKNLSASTTLIADWDSESDFTSLSSCPVRHSRYQIMYFQDSPYSQYLNADGKVYEVPTN